jgi:hypothetical protein
MILFISEGIAVVPHGAAAGDEAKGFAVRAEA